MKRIAEMNIGELAAYVCDYLNINGIECTLTGGACVTIYTENKYQSADLDFIEKRVYSRKKIIQLMNEIGFIEKNRYFVHPDTVWYVEFPSGPLSVGSEPMRDVIEIEYETGRLRIISPTECVKDRLAAYYFWEDLQSLAQAIMVASNQIVDLNEIERWSIVEKFNEKYLLFKNRLLKLITR